MEQEFSEIITSLIKNANFTVEQINLIKNPPVPNVKPEDFLSKKPRKLPQKIRKKGKRVTLRWANKFIQFRRYYERLERIKDTTKHIRDISKTASQEWKILKESEPKIIEFFELMSLLDKEYQKFISLNKDNHIHERYLKWKEANQPYHNTPLFVDNDINVVDIENIINAENYIHTTINADTNITNDNTEFMMNQQLTLNEPSDIETGFLYHGINSIIPDTAQLGDLIKFYEENQINLD
nr:4035_t:CDS:2 [Entrophospora candida]